MKRFLILFALWPLTGVLFGCRANRDTETFSTTFENPDELRSWASHQSSLSLGPRHGSSSSGAALVWRYTIRSHSWNMATKHRFSSRSFSNADGVSLWIRSCRTGALVFQFTEADGSVYRHFALASMLDTTWRRLCIRFQHCTLDPDGVDENGALDVDQIRSFDILEPGGFTGDIPTGERTVWVDDIDILPISEEPVTAPDKALRQPVTEHVPLRVTKSAGRRWYDDVQVYGIIPLLPDEARDLSITVNGVWGG
ncbi:MAG: hypothetical protein GF344_01220, partial [Chitinivibrionales bacterium]|nr:hypothetical protein [Chitinivibrionales bacterium]MBD3355719.1 hypothetical protein [Chitinivibrionales bacterium]